MKNERGEDRHRFLDNDVVPVTTIRMTRANTNSSNRAFYTLLRVPDEDEGYGTAEEVERIETYGVGV
jgi:hypothetical protein